jgi:choice-of-anchor B domain-containing protein
MSTKLIKFALCGLGALTISQWVFAHAEHDKARYVAENGQDQGRCDLTDKPCKTISYAAKQAGKGDRILVAEGRYAIEDMDSIFYLGGSAVPVSGGYQKETFQATEQAGKTILIGIPPEFAEGLSEKGFTVITDTKGLTRDQEAYLSAKQTQLEAMNNSQAAINCTNQKAGEFDCNRIDLLAHINLRTLGNSNSRGNDIWGHVDLNDGREYALVGLTNGVSIVEVTQAETPRLVTFIPSQQTVWRDLKTYQYFDETRRRWMSYAYITADAASVGTMILDLNELPLRVQQVSSEMTDTSAHNIYISNVDYSTGVALTNKKAYMHVAGSDKNGGAFNSYSLDNPTRPTAVYKSGGTRSLYSHDVSSLWIKDDRRQQCVNPLIDCDLLLDYNENEILLWDKTNNATPTQLSNTLYQYLSYVHSGWWTEDRKFITVHDELDEQRYSLTTRVRFFSIDNLRQPQLAGEYIGPTAAIDHNGYTRGNRYYISNYERGLVVLDISNPRNPTEVGFFDTYPLNNSASFNGAWGTYPFLPSGNILVSDINSGLYILRDNTQSAQGSVKFSASKISTAEGTNLQLVLQRIGGTQDAVEVSYETQAGNATESEDYTASAGTVQWAAGDASDKTIEIPIAADGQGNEFTQSFFVRLFNPRNGLSLSSPNLVVVSITDKPDEPVIISSSSAATSSVATSAPTKSSSGGGSLSWWMLLLSVIICFATKNREKNYQVI